MVTTTNDKILNTIGTAYLFNLDITWSRLTISYTVSATNKRFRNIVKWANQVSIDFREIAAFEDLPHNCDDQFFDFAKKDFPFPTLVTIRDLKMKNWSFIAAKCRHDDWSNDDIPPSDNWYKTMLCETSVRNADLGQLGPLWHMRFH